MNATRINQIDSLPGPVYVLVAGGIATGKSHVVKKFIKNIEIIDIDDFMEKNCFTDYDPKGYQFKKAMEDTAEYIRQHKAAKKSMVAMGTASNYEFARFRLDEAKRDGYTTVVLHVTLPFMETAWSLNRMRECKGQRAVKSKDLDILVTSYHSSSETVRRLYGEVPHLVDYQVHHVNDVVTELTSTARMILA